MDAKTGNDNSNKLEMPYISTASPQATKSTAIVNTVK